MCLGAAKITQCVVLQEHMGGSKLKSEVPLFSSQPFVGPDLGKNLYLPLRIIT